MRQTSLRFLAPLFILAISLPAIAEDKVVGALKVTHLIGLPSIKDNGKATLLVANGSLKVTAGTVVDEIKATSIDKIYTGHETTQGGGNYGTAAKVGSIAAPPGTGAAITLLLISKIDLLTIVYRGSEGELHSALLAVPKGEAEKIKTQLVAAGAHEGAN